MSQILFHHFGYDVFEVSEIMYSQVTQQAIAYIEEHLLDEIIFDHFPKKVGYSKFHFLRVFKKETGKTIGEYIRIRRLAVAATYLLQADVPIIDIAMALQFQSQEAFTRAFKELYTLPPGKYRKLMKTIRMVEEVQGMQQQSKIEGWILSGSHPWSYELRLDHNIFHTGNQSGHLYSVEEVHESQFATMMQSFQATDYKGKRLKLSCFLKTEDATKCCAWMRVDNGNGDVIQFDNMDSRPIRGTTEWNQYSIVLDVTEAGDGIYFGVLLAGTGKVWADNFRFEEVDEKTPTTNQLGSQSLPKQPVNLDFAE